MTESLMKTFFLFNNITLKKYNILNIQNGIKCSCNSQLQAKQIKCPQDIFAVNLLESDIMILSANLSITYLFFFLNVITISLEFNNSEGKTIHPVLIHSILKDLTETHSNLGKYSILFPN